MNSEPQYWSCERDDENLTHETVADAVEDKIENLLMSEVQIPSTVEVYGFAVCELPSVRNIAQTILDLIIEDYDEDYGSSEESTTITEKMNQAAMQFAEVFRNEYRTYRCKLIKTETVETAEYLENAS